MGSLWTEVGILLEEQSLAPDTHAARSVIGRLIADGTQVSRSQLVRATGLARSTVDKHLDGLLEAGLIEDAGFGKQDARGRPAQMFQVSAGKGVVLVAEVSTRTSRVALTTLDKTIVGRRELTIDVEAGPDVLLGALVEQFLALLKENGLTKDAALAVSVGLPGPVDSHLGMAVRPPLMPGWDGFGVCRFLAERLGCDVVVDNDVNLMALGAARALKGTHLPLLLVHIGPGVGGGFVGENGRLLHGADGAAVDIGHIRVPELPDALCRCGNRGCLEAVASTSAIAARFDMSEDELLASVTRGEANTISVVREVAIVVGRVIADLVNFCNPARIVLSGPLVQCTEEVLAQVRSVVYQQSRPLATRDLSLVHSSLGGEAGLIGGMVSAIEQVLSPRGIAYHTRPPDSSLLPLGL
ncbi:ROK family transcriptional regulator [Sciscionella sediminilitoris]|uniref:ROK family transcriptional regulator n=1 Tax=Sciscionella sediminilitoris TaxID=1445613 RepID=UPI00068DE6AD|nr:ROK family transcriptional regulator [Sciscionella sp. SE31]